MKNIKTLLPAFFIVFTACEKDFEVNAPWKEITIVYGLLNQQDTVHYIKINKAFLGEENALVMATEPDSSQYDPADIEVTIIGNPGATYILSDTLLTNKEAGDFYSPDHILYYFTEPNLGEDSDYELTITNKKTGKVITASTPVINSGVWCSNTDCSPSSFSGMKISFYANNDYENFIAKWKSVKDGMRYELTIRFHYIEKDLTTLVTTPKYINWLFTADSRADYLKGDVVISKEINGKEFYDYLASKIPIDNNVERSAPKLDFIVDVAGDEFNTYMEVNAPSTGIVQEKPEYTNITNDKGEDEIGIFSCRYYEIRADKELTFDSEVWLKSTGSPTAGLNFK